MKIYHIAFLLLYALNATAQHTEATAYRQEKFYAASLKEEQQLWIHFPEGYDTAKSSYAVLYILDADGHFNYISNYADYLAKPFAKVIPPLIVVGIRSLSVAYRYANFTPYSENQKEGRGNADIFIAFLEKELIPHIDKTYRTTGENILAGHSLGGLLGLYTLTVRPCLFKRIIAVSPSLSYGDGVMMRKYIPAYFEQANQPVQHIHFSVSSNDLDDYKIFCERLRDTLQKVDAVSLKWGFDVFDGTDHYTVAPAAFHKGLIHIFKE